MREKFIVFLKLGIVATERTLPAASHIVQDVLFAYNHVNYRFHLESP